MSILPKISESEYEIMKVIWKHSPISTNDITNILTKRTSWSPKTIQTLIKRLVTKGALSYEKHSRVYVYTPLVDEKEYISQKSKTFLDQYFNGNISTMVSSYIEDEKLTKDEINSLRSILQKMEHKGGK